MNRWREKLGGAPPIVRLLVAALFGLLVVVIFYYATGRVWPLRYLIGLSLAWDVGFYSCDQLTWKARRSMG